MYCSVTEKVAEKLPFHDHLSHELIVCKGDSGELEVNGQRYPFKCGRTFLLPSGIKHRVIGLPSSVAHTQFICFDDGLINYLNLLPINTYLSLSYAKYTVAECANDEALYACNEQLASRFQSEVDKPSLYSKQMSNCILAQLLINHCRHTKIPGLIKNNNKRFAIEQCCEAILSDPAKPITLGSVAKQHYMSRSHFAAQFKRVTGKSLIEYTNRVRIEKACQQLVTTNETVTHIAYECGFANLGNFYKTFKKQFQMTPAEYRRWSGSQADPLMSESTSVSSAK
jgi:AraC-like DNA-binding protein